MNPWSYEVNYHSQWYVPLMCILLFQIAQFIQFHPYLDDPLSNQALTIFQTNHCFPGRAGIVATSQKSNRPRYKSTVVYIHVLPLITLPPFLADRPGFHSLVQNQIIQANYFVAPSPGESGKYNYDRILHINQEGVQFTFVDQSRKFPTSDMPTFWL
jgi:hypothetical protein